jgi:hypothetical protein
MMIVAAIAIAMIFCTASLAFALPYARRVLLRWYVREVEQVQPVEMPGEAIVTYPLA